MYDVTTDIFDKEFICPICNNKFKTKTVKSKSPRVASKDSDFFIRYKTVNPYFYDVCLCNSCGYAAMKSDFDKIRSYHKDLILNNITKRWTPKSYPEILTAEIAIERYKLALLSAITLEKPSSTKAMILLKISWMYRLLDNSKEIETLRNSLDEFVQAYQNEDFPIYGMQRESLSYLIGDLHRRCGNFDEALRWYSKVLTTIGCPQKVKELARNGKDCIKLNL